MPHRRSRSVIQRRSQIAALGNLPKDAFANVHFTPADAAALQAQLIGSVVTPATPGYDSDRQLSDAVWQALPAVIVYCQTFNDVWYTLGFARRFGLHVVCRSGGHSTAGFSCETGALVLDTSRMSYVVVDAKKRTARVGSGTPLGMLYSVLDSYKLHTSGGSCPDVGIAGHMMGGGYGWTSRQYGMNCDNVLEVLVMLADGRTVRANAEVNRDLHWAVCGGTGNNFGVLLEITYQLHDLWKVWGFGFSYPMKKAPDALYALQHDYMMDAGPREFGAQVAWITRNGEQRLVVRGTYHGAADKGRKLIAPLLKLPGATSEIDKVAPFASLNDNLVEQPYEYPDLPLGAVEDKLSGYCAKLLDRADWKALAEAAMKDPLGWAFANLEIYGGAINARPIESNAFVHRNVYFDWVQDIFWVTDSERKVAEKFLRDMVAAWKPFLNGHANQDYPRRSQTNYRWLFFGNAFNTLLWVKRKYDPTNFFHYEQSISPYPKGAKPRDTSTSLFSDKSIVEEPYSRLIK